MGENEEIKSVMIERTILAVSVSQMRTITPARLSFRPVSSRLQVDTLLLTKQVPV